MTEQSWKPLFRSPRATITKVLRSPAFADSRHRAAAIITDAEALRALAERVESLDQTRMPLSTISDRVGAAVSFLRARADRIDSDGDGPAGGEVQGAAAEARERLVVAALHYLVTPVDLVPDFRAGGYLDDVLLLGWVFGTAASELEPFLGKEPDA